jgi:hypothetical protein
VRLSRSTSRRTAISAVSIGAAVALTSACGAKVETPSASAAGSPVPTSAVTTEAPSSTTSPPPTAPPLPNTWPLTGLPGDPATIHGTPVIAVKVDNNPDARPHSHIASADMVYEIQVEGITRFMELFNSNIPNRVGPVRSARSSDIDLFGNLNRPVLMWSGGNAGVTGEVNQAAASGVIVDAGDTGPAQKDFYRDSRGTGVAYEHTLFGNPQQVRADFAPPDETGPAPIFTFRSGGVDTLGPDAAPAAGVTVNFNTYATVRADYAWDASRSCWDRFQVDQSHGRANSALMDETGVQVCPQNVVVLFLQYAPDVIDGRSPKAVSVGTGDGWVFTAGKVIPIHWSRPTPKDGWTLTDSGTGAVVPLTPGQTWFELPKAGQDSADVLDQGTADGMLAYKR